MQAKVTFRCKRSGNTVSFTNEQDIRGLRQHEGYIEIKENENVKEQISTNAGAHAERRSSMPNDAKTEMLGDKNEEIKEENRNWKEKVLIPQFTKEKKRGRPAKH